MKKLFYFLLLGLHCAFQAQATDRYVNPSLWPSLPANTYMTVTAALTAAQSGDRIFIAPGAYATPDITISQNIEIYSMDTTDVVQLYNGSLTTGTNITINGSANMQVKLSGFKCGGITLNAANDMLLQIWNMTISAAYLYASSNNNVQVDIERLINTGSIACYGGTNFNLKIWKTQTGSTSISSYGTGVQVSMDSVASTSNLSYDPSGNINQKLIVSNSQFTNFQMNTPATQLKVYFTKVNLTGNITLKGDNNNLFEFTGCSAASLSSTSNSASASNRAKINVIDCAFSSSITLDHDNFLFNCIHTQITGTTLFRFGNIITSRTNNLTIQNEGNAIDTLGKILIAADTIDGTLGYNNDKTRFVIANNILQKVRLQKWLSHNSVTNQIINNEFASGAVLDIPSIGVPKYNFDVSNNIFQNFQFSNAAIQCYIWGNYSCSMYVNSNGCIPAPHCNSYNMYNYDAPIINIGQTYTCYFYTNWWGWQNYSYTFSPNSNSDVNQCPFPNRDAPGFFKWTYNGFAIPGAGSTPGNLTFINIPGTTNTVNAGNPATEYTDIDLSRNDRGRLGGPYSILNYNPANPNNSKAFIYDLDIPTQINPSAQPINIRAKAYHR